MGKGDTYKTFKRVKSVSASDWVLHTFFLDRIIGKMTELVNKRLLVRNLISSAERGKQYKFKLSEHEVGSSHLMRIETPNGPYPC